MLRSFTPRITITITVLASTPTHDNARDNHISAEKNLSERYRNYILVVIIVVWTYNYHPCCEWTLTMGGLFAPTLTPIQKNYFALIYHSKVIFITVYRTTFFSLFFPNPTHVAHHYTQRMTAHYKMSDFFPITSGMKCHFKIFLDTVEWNL